MNLEGVSLAIEPRSVGASIDLATLFYRTHTWKFLGLSLVFGGPATLLGYWLTSAGGMGWFWTGLIFFFASPFLGATVVAGAGHRVFGDPFTVARALQVTARHAGSLLYLLLLSRLVIGMLAVFCWGLPLLPLAARYGFLSEVVLLEQLRGRRVNRRIGELMRHTFWEAMGRCMAIFFFALAIFLSVFTLVDIGSGFFFGFPILLGKLSSHFFFDDLVGLAFLDPLVVATASGTAWLAYPLARLAWFFCYLDARIRKEGWDVELAFRVEAERLKTIS